MVVRSCSSDQYLKCIVSPLVLHGENSESMEESRDSSFGGTLVWEASRINKSIHLFSNISRGFLV